MAEDKTDQVSDQISDPLPGEDAKEQSGGLNAKKMILFIILPLLILSGGITTAYFMGYLDSILGIEMTCDHIDETDPEYDECIERQALAQGREGAAPGLYYAMPDIRVNLNQRGGGRQQFLFLVIQLELADERSLARVEQYIPRITDHFQTYLRELRLEDLQGSAGIYRLRLELLERVNAAAPDLDVRDVLFQEMLVQ